MSYLSKIGYDILSLDDVYNLLKVFYNSCKFATEASLLRVGMSAGRKPIYALKIGSGHPIIIIARIHGNEPAPTNAVLSLIHDITLYKDLRTYLKDLSLVVVPVANPDGAELFYIRYMKYDFEPSWKHTFEKARANANGVDLNRDWMLLTQPETQALHNVISRENPVFLIDSHEFYYKGEYPPKWPEDFMVTLTDAMYEGVHEDIAKVSEEVMVFVANRLAQSEWRHWKVKYRHFTGGANEKLKVALPTILGVHVAIEGVPKLLVETWGVGLGTYLLHDRLTIHKIAYYATIQYVYENLEKFLEAKERFVKCEMSAPNLKYVIKSKYISEVRKVASKLAIHGIYYTYENNTAVVELPQKRSTMARLLLDREFELNKKIERKFGEVFTLDRYHEVTIEVKR